MNSCDVGRGRGGVDAALARVTARALVAGVDSDRLYPLALQQQVADALGVPLQVISSPYGHDGFLIEVDAVGDRLLQRPARRLTSVASGAMTYDVAPSARISRAAQRTAHFDGPGGIADARASSPSGGRHADRAISNRGRITAAERHATAWSWAPAQAVADLLGAEPRGVVFGRSTTQLTYDLSRALAAVGTGRRGRRQPAGPRREHPAVGAGRGGRRRHGALGRVRPGDRRAHRRTPSPRVLSRADPPGRRDRRVQPDRDPARRRRDRRLVHEAGALLRRRRAPDRTRGGRRRRARRGLLRLLAVQVPRPALRRARRPPALLETLHPDKLLPSTDAVPERFELGTLPYELLAGTTAAVDFLPPRPRPAARARAAARRMAAVEQHEDLARAARGRPWPSCPA